MGKDIGDILSKSVHELKEYLHTQESDIPDKLLRALAADPRKTARQLGDLIQRRRLRNLRTKLVQKLRTFVH